MHLNDIRRILRTRWPIVAFSTAFALVAAGALLPSKLAPSGNQLRAKATTTLVLQSQGNKASTEKAATSQLSTLKVIASEGEVPTQAAAALGTSTPALQARVTVTTSPTTNSLSISAVDRTKDRAAKTVETYSKKLLDLLTTQAQASQSAAKNALTEQVDKLKADKAPLDANAKTDPVSKAGAEAIARELNVQQTKLDAITGAPPIVPPLRSVGPPTVRQLTTSQSANRFLKLPVRLGIAGLLGSVLSLAALVLLSRFDDHLQTKAAAELAYGVPVLAEVPVLPRKRSGALLLASEPHGAYAEAHRILRTSILRSDPGSADRPPHERPRSCLIVVTSAEPVEGKTSTAVNLAASFAEAGSDTILAGLDLRHNDVHDLVPTGLQSDETVLPTGRNGTAPIRVAVQASSLRGLRLVTVSPGDPPAVVLPVVAAWLRDLRDQVDVIVVDTPPLLVCNDASEVIPFADTVLVACRVGVTTIEAAELARDTLARLQAPVCGSVLVGAALRASAQRVSTYRAAAWGPPGAEPGGAATDGPVGTLGPPEPVASWRGPAPQHAPDTEQEAQDEARPGNPVPLPVPVPVLSEDGEAQHAAARTVASPDATAERVFGPDVGRIEAVPPPAEPSAEIRAPAAKERWRPVPMPAGGATQIARRTLDLARGRLAGRRNRRR